MDQTVLAIAAGIDHPVLSMVDLCAGWKFFDRSTADSLPQKTWASDHFRLMNALWVD